MLKVNMLINSWKKAFLQTIIKYFQGNQGCHSGIGK